MAFKHILVTSLLIAAMAIPRAKAQLGLLNDLLGSISIQGVVTCTSKDNVGANGAATPVFSSKLKLKGVVCFHCLLYKYLETGNREQEQNNSFVIILVIIIFKIRKLEINHFFTNN